MSDSVIDMLVFYVFLALAGGAWMAVAVGLWPLTLVAVWCTGIALKYLLMATQEAKA